MKRQTASLAALHAEHIKVQLLTVNLQRLRQLGLGAAAKSFQWTSQCEKLHLTQTVSTFQGVSRHFTSLFTANTLTHTHKRIHAYKYVCCWYSCRHFAFILVGRVGVALLWAHFDATFHCMRLSNFATLIVELPPPAPSLYLQPLTLLIAISCHLDVSLLDCICFV